MIRKNNHLLDIKYEVECFQNWIVEKNEAIEQVKIYRVAKWSSSQRKKKLSHYKVRRI
jgi:hypothetical protein